MTSAIKMAIVPCAGVEKVAIEIDLLTLLIIKLKNFTNMKEMRQYEAPEMEIVEVELTSSLLNMSIEQPWAPELDEEDV